MTKKGQKQRKKKLPGTGNVSMASFRISERTLKKFKRICEKEMLNYTTVFRFLTEQFILLHDPNWDKWGLRKTNMDIEDEEEGGTGE